MLSPAGRMLGYPLSGSLDGRIGAKERMPKGAGLAVAEEAVERAVAAEGFGVRN